MTNEPSAAQRKLYAKMHYAMPNGSFYIRPLPEGKIDLENAIKAVGRGEQGGTSGAAIRKHIMMRAAAIKLSSEIPDTWNSDGTLKEAAQSAMTVGELLEHHGVKGMHWGVRKPSDAVASARVREPGKRNTVKSVPQDTARKAAKTAYNHPYATTAAAYGLALAVDHREEIKNTAIILGKIGAYAMKQATTKDSPVNETLAIGRQVVQGFVVHGDLAAHGIDGVDALKPQPGDPPNQSSEASDHDMVIQAAEDHEAVAAAHVAEAKKTQAQDAELMKQGLDSPAAKSAYGENASKQGDGEFRAKNAMSKAQAVTKLHNNLQASASQHMQSANQHNVLAQKLRDKASSMSQDALHFDPNFDVDVYLSHFGVKGMQWGVRKARGPGSQDHEHVVAIRSKAKQGGGIHVLSNDELQDVNTRLNLETNYQRLISGGGSAISDGEKFVKSTTGKVQTGINAVTTGRQAYKLITELSGKK